MNLRTMRILTVVLPILSLTVATATVTHQYMRRNGLKHQLESTERRCDALRKLVEQLNASRKHPEGKPKDER